MKVCVINIRLPSCGNGCWFAWVSPKKKHILYFKVLKTFKYYQNRDHSIYCIFKFNLKTYRSLVYIVPNTMRCDGPNVYTK